MISEARALVPSFSGPIVRYGYRRIVVERSATATALAVCVGAPLWLLSSGLALGAAAVAVAVALTLVIALAGGDAIPREERDGALATANVSTEALGKLTALVYQIGRLDRGAVARYELEALLDRHVVVALAHDRAIRASALGSRAELERTRETCASHGRARHLEICEDRLRWLDHCEAIASALGEELSTIADMIGAIAQIATCPELPPGDGVIERCREELSAATAAHAELG
ncbi:MAG: hypothetical protein ABI678_30425 [Kofleriaceae bacterium]